MRFPIRSAVERGRKFAFPATWVAMLSVGVGFGEPLPSIDVTPHMSFAPIGAASAAMPPQSALLVPDRVPESLVFVRHEPSEPDDIFHRSTRESSWGHGRFAAPGNALRRQVQLRAINPRTA